MTDDQTVESMRVMPNVTRLLGEQGVTFRNNFVSYPLCCPSRATFLTGQYSHNHGVVSNRALLGGGYEQLDSTNTLPVWLQSIGYRTTHIGKYLNGYGRRDPREVPPGWTEWYTTTSHVKAYGYTANENGTVREYGYAEEDYHTDVSARRALEVIRRQATDDQPFFLSIDFFAPHDSSTGPDNPNGDPNGKLPDAAPRHRGAFADEPLPTTPSFNEADVSDKPWQVRDRPALDGTAIEAVTARYRARLASLLAVDEAVATIVRTLEEVGELDRTYVIFTSDNGFLLGEHRQPKGKQELYEESIRVPLIIRGPRVARGATSEAMAANIDLAPTITQIAGATPGRSMDGRSLLPLLAQPGTRIPRTMLIENLSQHAYAAVRTDRYLYAEHETGERELYDLLEDPYQLASRHDDPAYAAVRTDLATRLATLRSCSGQRCR